MKIKEIVTKVALSIPKHFKRPSFNDKIPKQEQKEHSSHEKVKKRINIKKEKHKKKEKQKARIRNKLELAGIMKDPQKVQKYLMTAGGVIALFLIIGFSVLLFRIYPFTFLYLFFIILIGGTIGYLASTFIVWIGFYIYIDLRMYQRRVEIEKVLPDFLQLTSSNIKSGIPIDRALWLAVRPRFGVLAKEIEMVAKETMTGNDLEMALTNFSVKYDSMILKRAISLIIEGLKSGGELGDLLNRISTDIQDSSILKKEMAASLTTYVIFISFATILAAPFLFGLASQLLNIVHEVTSSIDMPDTGTTGMGISVAGGGINSGDFRIFAISMLIVTSFFSSLIIATIKKGDIRAGVRYIPIFIFSTIILFFLASWMLGRIFGGMF